MHNIADNNTMSTRRETVSKLTDTLGSESSIAIDWFTKNEMIINLDKFQAIISWKKNPILQTFRWLLIVKLLSPFHQ